MLSVPGAVLCVRGRLPCRSLAALCVWHCAVLVPIYAAVPPSQGEEEEKEGGLLSFFFFSLLFFSLFFFPKLHPSESVIEVIQCRSARSSTQGWQIP